MTDGELISIDGRPALRFERRLGHSIERVWRAVSDPSEMEGWFVAPAPWTPVEGEVFEAAGHQGRVTELRPPRRLAWTWAEERYSFDLEEAGSGCVLTFIHVFDPAYGPPAQHAAGWEGYLRRLEAHLEGGHLSEQAAHEGIEARIERYRERFDAADAVLLDGPVLRFERRLAHPAERVWRAISDPAELAQWFPSDDADLTVIESEAPRLLVVRWFGDPLRFELRPQGDAACVLVFTHAFDDRATAARTAAGWDRCFVRLAGLLDGAPVGEAEALEGWPEVHERYAEAFGVDPEIGREAFRNHPLTS